PPAPNGTSTVTDRVGQSADRAGPASAAIASVNNATGSFRARYIFFSAGSIDAKPRAVRGGWQVRPAEALSKQITLVSSRPAALSCRQVSHEVSVCADFPTQAAALAEWEAARRDDHHQSRVLGPDQGHAEALLSRRPWYRRRRPARQRLRQSEL